MGQPRRPDQQFSPPATATPPSTQTGVFRGSRITVFGPGSFIRAYNPKPEANALVYSESPLSTTTTDQFGNVILPGTTDYDTTNWTAINTSGSGLTFYKNSVSGQSGTWTQEGAVTFQTGTSPKLVLPSGYTGVIPATQSDSTTFTATQNTVRQLSKSWSIPANDAAANTIYRLTVWGTGTNGTTADASSWNVTIGASGNGVSTVSILNLSIPTAVWGISVAANFRLVAELQCTAAGASGNFNADGSWMLTNSATNAAMYAVALVDNTNTVDTTAAHFIQFNWQWATTTGGPTISSFGSILERISG